MADHTQLTTRAAPHEVWYDHASHTTYWVLQKHPLTNYAQQDQQLDMMTVEMVDITSENGYGLIIKIPAEQVMTGNELVQRDGVFFELPPRQAEGQPVYYEGGTL